MITEIDNGERSAWEALGIAISGQLRRELRETQVGEAVRQLLAEQVQLITSIPLQAAERVQALSLEALGTGERAPMLADIIQQTMHATRARAMTIARTETSRAATTLTQARAEGVGGTAYIWRTSRDSAVRPSHKAMEGRVVEWDDPPTLDGLTGHPGALPNCRCYPEPIVPDPYTPTVRGRRR